MEIHTLEHMHQNLDQKTETLLIGGSWNPATIGHEAILRGGVAYAAPRHADIWLVPSGIRTDKPVVFDRDARYTMTEAYRHDVDSRGVQVDILTTELDRPTSVETYDTVLELNEAYPDRSFTWVFGADSTQTMGKWEHGDELLRHLPVLAVEREGYAINPAMRQLRGVLNIPSLDVSSTMVRERMAQGLPVDHLVGRHVLELLMK